MATFVIFCTDYSVLCTFLHNDPKWDHSSACAQCYHLGSSCYKGLTCTLQNYFVRAMAVCSYIIRYADDVVLLASSAQELQELVSRVEQASAKYGLQINVNKSKVMTTNGDKVSIRFDQEVMEQVEKFACLGAIISEAP